MLGAKRSAASGKPAGLGVQKLSAKVDESLFEQEPEERIMAPTPKAAAFTPTASSKSLNISSNGGGSATAASDQDAQRRFANAKSISSAQFFGQEDQASNAEREQK